MKILSAQQMRELEQRAVNEGATYYFLMKTAGQAAAQVLLDRMGAKQGCQVAVVCGKGNNGGDGCVAAGYLKQKGIQAVILLIDGEPRTPDALAALKAASACGVPVWRYWESKEKVFEKLDSADFIIDALYGIGFQGALSEPMYELIQRANSKGGRVLSIDLPSGVQCDTGHVVNGAFQATMTVSFTTLKAAHVLYPSMDYCGETVIAPVGIDQALVEDSPCLYQTVTEQYAYAALPARKISDNKGSCGTLFSICGSYGMAGAAVMSTNAALRCGVGLVRLALPRCIYPIVATQLVQPVYIPVEDRDGGISSSAIPCLLEQAQRASAVLLGCGLGLSEASKKLVHEFIRTVRIPLILDADGINALCGHIDILKEAKAPVILTPHPGECARLFDVTVEQVQSARFDYAQRLAQDYGVTVVLKGAKTLIAGAEGETLVNPTGNAGMAKAGSGDVLAGMIASLAAQGVQPFRAAAAGVYLHGLAGDCCAEKYGKLSMLPTDMVEILPYVIKNAFAGK